MHKKFEINRTKIKGGCQLVTYNSKSDLPLVQPEYIPVMFEKKKHEN